MTCSPEFGQLDAEDKRKDSSGDEQNQREHRVLDADDLVIKTQSPEALSGLLFFDLIRLGGFFALCPAEPIVKSAKGDHKADHAYHTAEYPGRFGPGFQAERGADGGHQAKAKRRADNLP